MVYWNPSSLVIFVNDAKYIHFYPTFQLPPALHTASMTACICFDFPEKLCMRTYLAGKTKINTGKVLTASEQSSHQFIHQFRICAFWEKYARQLRSIRMYKSKVNYFFTILSYNFSETISRAKNNKMGHC